MPSAARQLQEVSDPPTDLSELTLDQLAVEVRREHAAAKAALDQAVVRAINAGVYLLEAKARTKHDGSWGRWVTENFSDLTGWSQRTAQLYMRFARRREEAQRLAHLGIGGVARAFSERRQEIELELADLYLTPEQTAIVAALPTEQRGELARLLRWLEDAPPTDEELLAIASAFRKVTKQQRAMLGLNLIGRQGESSYTETVEEHVRGSVNEALLDLLRAGASLRRHSPEDVRAVIEDLDPAVWGGDSPERRRRTWAAVMLRLTVLTALEHRVRPEPPPIEGAASP